MWNQKEQQQWNDIWGASIVFNENIIASVITAVVADAWCKRALWKKGKIPLSLTLCEMFVVLIYDT